MRHTVLIIEDNEINRDILNEMLKDSYNLLFAENGKEGLDILRESCTEIDIVLLDIAMPFMNGYEVLQVKSKDTLMRDIPTIVTTGSEATEEEMRCLTMGAADFIRKPYDPVVVNLRIKNILNLRESTEANRQKSLFIQNISHEVRTPMNAIMGFANILKEMGNELEPEERDMYMSYITENSSALMGLIDNMLTLSTLDSNTIYFNRQNVTVKQLCQQALDSTKHLHPEGVKVNYTSDIPEAGSITTDSKHVLTALCNYLSNSCKFTTQGEINIHSTLNEKEGFCTITVTDTGIGIDPEKAEIIFKRFEKLDSFVPGMGLGLTITRKLAQILGGEAFLDISHSGPGSRFVLRLPV